MKKSTLLTVYFTALLFLGFQLVGWGQVALPHLEAFDYTVGQALQTQSGWAAVNSGDDILISSGNLSYSGLQTSTGNKITFAGSGIDASKAIAPQATGTVYYSFIMKVTNLGALNAAGGYFTGFGQNATTFGATVWTGLDGTGYKIGINPRTSLTTNMVWVAGTQALNNEVFVVVSYEFGTGASDDIANIWVNPGSSTFGSATAPAVSATVTNLTGTDLTSIVQFFIRQDSDTETPSMEMDECRIGTSWADVTPAATTSQIAADLFFSEYDEGTGGNDRAFEIFNGTGAPVDLSAYSVKQSHNGDGWGIAGGVVIADYVLPLSGTLANGDVYVVYNIATTLTAISSVGDLALDYNVPPGGRNTSFTGDDAMGLFKNDALIDVIGVELKTVSAGPWDVAGVAGATMNHTLVRKATVTEGTTDWALSAGTNVEDSEWIVFPVDYFDNLGTHTFGVPVDVTAPVLTATPKDGDTEVAVNIPIVLTFDESIRNIDDSEITDTNVADLLTLKETDAAGADVPFTATIDAAKRVITVTPAADFTIGTVYYGAIAPVEDAADNATIEKSMTFTTITKYIVTFNVDMSLVKGFDPLTDTVYVAGSMAGDWTQPGSNLDYIMKDPDGNMIYTLALPLDIPVGNIEYKFFINAGWNTWGEWPGPPNRLATITGNTTLNAIFGNQGVPVFVNVPYVQDFGYSTANSTMALAGWTTANLETGGTALWQSREFSANKYGQVTSFGSALTGADQIWLITPGIIIPDTVIADLTFDVNVGYWTHDGLTVWISTDYDQTTSGIATATWTDVTREFTIPSTPTNAYGTFTNAGHLDVSAYTGNMYVAFVYDGNKSASQTTTYQVDNVEVNILGYVGLNKISKSVVTIYPNPSNGRLQITNPTNETQEIAVFNSLGKQVKSTVSAKGIISLDITTQSKGFYLVKITNKTNNSVQYKKIVLN